MMMASTEEAMEGTGPDPEEEGKAQVVSLDFIHNRMKEPALFPPRKKGNAAKKTKKKWNAKPARTSDAKPEIESPSLPIDVFRWEEHESVIFLVFPNRIVLRHALARLSVFLEDPKHAGEVVEPNMRPGKYAATNYTGHNFRPSDLKQFVDAVSRSEWSLEPEEERLRDTIAGELEEDWESEDLGKGVGCIATSRGLSGSEVSGTLKHEAMHGLFYAHESLREASWSFWSKALNREQRTLWQVFLASFGYNYDNEELCVNEMLAYLYTEEQLLRNASYLKDAGFVGVENGMNHSQQLQHMKKIFIDFIDAANLSHLITL